MDEITAFIPQRPPFLFVDKIVKIEGNKIEARKYLSGEEEFFKGHFPGNPIMPGVLLQEAIFQTGAALMGQREGGGKLGVVTKVENARFKGFVRPGEELILEVELLEAISNAYYMKGKITVKDKVVMSVNFTCALI